MSKPFLREYKGIICAIISEESKSGSADFAQLCTQYRDSKNSTERDSLKEKILKRIQKHKKETEKNENEKVTN